MVDSITPALPKEHFDVDHAFIAHLNGECLDWAGMDGGALQQALQAQGDEWYGLVKERCPHLFAAAPVFITEMQLQQMRAVIAAVEEAVLDEKGGGVSGRVLRLRLSPERAGYAPDRGQYQCGRRLSA